MNSNNKFIQIISTFDYRDTAIELLDEILNTLKHNLLKFSRKLKTKTVLTYTLEHSILKSLYIMAHKEVIIA